MRVVALATTVLVAAFVCTPAVASHLSNYTAPTELGASVAGGDVTLTWDAYPAGNFPAFCTQAREIRIFRNVNGGAFEQITAALPTATMYLDENLADGEYGYKIQAKCNVPAVPSVSPADTNNLSAFSNTVTAEVTSAPPCAGPPTIEASAAPVLLWPPNGKLVAVTVTGTVTPAANCSLPENILYSIVDEYGELTSTSPATVALANGGTFNIQISLEASRRGDDLDGRWYTIQLYTTDGGIVEGYVSVPHDQRKK